MMLRGGHVSVSRLLQEKTREETKLHTTFSELRTRFQTFYTTESHRRTNTRVRACTFEPHHAERLSTKLKPRGGAKTYKVSEI